jgi:ABC-type transporter Mla subunit MlaD
MSPSAGTDRMKLELKRSAGPFILFVLLCFAGLLTAADIIKNLAGNKPWISYNSYRVAVTDAKNVIPGEVELKIAGVNVGSIAGSRLVQGHPVLTLNLESQYAPLYRDATVRVRPVTPLEDMYVDIISRGHKSAGVLASNQILPVTQTVSPVEVGSVLDTLDANTRQRMAVLLNQLGRGLSDGGANLRAGFEAISPFLLVASQMSSALARQRVELARLVHNFGGITQEVALRDTELTSFVRSTSSTLGALARTSGPFTATINELPGTLASVSSAFTRVRTAETALDPALRSLGPVAAALPSGLGALSRFSQDATPAVNALRPAVRELRPLAQVLLPTATALDGAFTQLQPEAPQIDRMTALAANPSCLTYIGQFLNRVISLTKFGAGQNNIANARADVSIGFDTAGDLIRDPTWKITPPCYTANATGAATP